MSISDHKLQAKSKWTGYFLLKFLLLIVVSFEDDLGIASLHLYKIMSLDFHIICKVSIFLKEEIIVKIYH